MGIYLFKVFQSNSLVQQKMRFIYIRSVLFSEISYPDLYYPKIFFLMMIGRLVYLSLICHNVETLGVTECPYVNKSALLSTHIRLKEVVCL